MRMIMKKRVVRRTKTDNQKIHFQVRCLQRLGFLVDHDELVQLIQNGKLDLIEKQSNRVSKFLWKHNGKQYVLVYDKKRKRVVTIMYKL